MCRRRNALMHLIDKLCNHPNIFSISISNGMGSFTSSILYFEPYFCCNALQQKYGSKYNIEEVKEPIPLEMDILKMLG